MHDTITFDSFTPDHLDAALRLSRAAGWPHRREDWDLVLSISRGIVALAGGQVVGTAIATGFGPVAMANMIIVDEAMRGRGLGRNLMVRMTDLAAPQEWRLVASADGLPLYEKLGFQQTGQIVQLQGHLTALPAADEAEWARPGDMPAILAMDHAATGADRNHLLARLARDGRLAVIRQAGTAVAYGALRDFGRGQVAGPVIAQSDDHAKQLLSFLFSATSGGLLRVDTTTATALSPWLQTVGLRPVGGGIAMRRGGPLAWTSPFQPYALAAQALG